MILRAIFSLLLMTTGALAHPAATMHAHPHDGALAVFIGIGAAVVVIAGFTIIASLRKRS